MLRRNTMKIIVKVKIIIDTGLANHCSLNPYTTAVFLHVFPVVFSLRNTIALTIRVDCVWNVMAHAQKQDFVFRRNRWVLLNRWGRQFSQLPAAEVSASAVVMLDTPCSEVVWRILPTHSICQFPLHFPSRASPCVITFQLDSKNVSSIP
jgi:hypothetical protein